MDRSLPAFPLRFAALAISVALATAACGKPATGSTAPPTAHASSGAPACAAAPSVPDDLEGWGPPAQPPQVVPVLIPGQSILVCGPNRFMFALVDPSSRPIAAPDRSLRVALFNLGRDPKTPMTTIDGAFVWAIEGARGVYVIDASFPEAGQYGAEVTTAAAGGAPVSVRLTFDVQRSSPVVKVGDRAPASKTPTLADVGGDVTHISTDATPDPALYQTSVDQALAAHKPFVVIFATPKFCKTAQCGPTLDRIKPFLAKYPGVTFINVEPYRLKVVDGTLEPELAATGDLIPTAATDEWHLFNEPSVFVVDREGIVRSEFDLIFSDAELTTALDAVK